MKHSRLKIDGLVETLYIRGFMLYDFKRGLKTPELARNINSKYDQSLVSEHRVQGQLALFQPGDHDVEDWPRLGRPSEQGGQQLRQWIKKDR